MVRFFHGQICLQTLLTPDKNNTVKPLFRDTSLLRTADCVPGDRKPLTFFQNSTRLNTDIPLIRTAPSVSVLAGFDCNIVEVI